jgi:hypothetical protein
MRAYARMANDTQLEMDSAELRLRAERRLGIMLSQAKQAGQFSRLSKPSSQMSVSVLPIRMGL